MGLFEKCVYWEIKNHEHQQKKCSELLAFFERPLNSNNSYSVPAMNFAPNGDGKHHVKINKMLLDLLVPFSCFSVTHASL